MSEQPTWTHNGVVITLDSETGKFSATLGERHVSSLSLDAMKKRIDEDRKIAFEPFECIHYDDPHYYGNRKPERGRIKEPRTVVGLVASTRSRGYRSSASFVVSRGAEALGAFHTYAVVPNTKENRQAVQAFLTAKHANNIVRAQMDAEELELENAIRHMDADRYEEGDKSAMTRKEREAAKKDKARLGTGR